MRMQTSKELQNKALEMYPDAIKASQEAGTKALNGLFEAVEGDDESLEARKLGAMIAATDFLETCGTVVVRIDDGVDED